MQKNKQKDNARLLASFGLDTQMLSLDDGSILSSLEVVRHVPSRRCVCRAIWQDKPVYAKLFFGHKAAHYAARDVAGVDSLLSANLLTPKILFQCEIKGNKGYAVVFEEISASTNAEDLWVSSSDVARLKLAEQLVEVVAGHHEAGLVQTDLYLKNFLVKGKAIYSIDGDGIRSIGELSKKKALDNLSQLLSKFDVLLLDRHLLSLLSIYVKARAWHELPKGAAVKKRIGAARRRATSSYADKKVFRQCTDVDVAEIKHIFVAVRSEYSILDLPKKIAAFDTYFKPDNIIKNGNTCTVALTDVNSTPIVIKRYNIKGFWHGVGRAFRQTRASISWANAHRLKLLALNTANPVALIEKRRLGCKGGAYFLTEYVDAPDISGYFKQTSDGTLRAQAVKELVQLFYRLYLLQISHGDMKATNIKVLADGQPLLIDLDSMQQHGYGFFAKKAHVRDIKRFMQNWKGEPSLYNAFVKVFKVVYTDHAPLQAAQILK